MDGSASLDVSFDLLEIGHVLMNGYRFNAALEYYRRALSVRQALAAADPQNVLGRTRLAFAHLAVARALFATGDTTASLASARSSTAIFAEVAAANPADKQSWYWLVDDYAISGDAEARLGRMKQACPSYEHGAQVYALLARVRDPDAALTKLKGRIDAGLARSRGL